MPTTTRCVLVDCETTSQGRIATDAGQLATTAVSVLRDPLRCTACSSPESIAGVYPTRSTSSLAAGPTRRSAYPRRSNTQRRTNDSTRDRRLTTEPGVHYGRLRQRSRASCRSPRPRSSAMPVTRGLRAGRRAASANCPPSPSEPPFKPNVNDREGRRLLDRGRPAARLRPEEEVPRHRGRLRRAEAPARRPGDAELARAAVARRPGVHRRRHRQPRHAGPRPRLGAGRSTRSSAPCRSKIR